MSHMASLINKQASLCYRNIYTPYRLISDKNDSLKREFLRCFFFLLLQISQTIATTDIHIQRNPAYKTMSFQKTSFKVLTQIAILNHSLVQYHGRNDFILGKVCHVLHRLSTSFGDVFNIASLSVID